MITLLATLLAGSDKDALHSTARTQPRKVRLDGVTKEHRTQILGAATDTRIVPVFAASEARTFSGPLSPYLEDSTLDSTTAETPVSWFSKTPALTQAARNEGDRSCFGRWPGGRMQMVLNPHPLPP